MNSGATFVNGVYYPPGTSQNNSLSSPLSPLSSPGFQSSGVPASMSPPPPKEKQAMVVSWQDIADLLDLPATTIIPDRPQPGQLPDGRYFTPKNPRKDHYLIFGSKPEYIANFVHHYFSMNNMSRDKTLQDLMVDGGTVPLIDLLKFPKLSQVNTTEQDLVEALSDSYKCCLVNLPNNALGVQRKDKWSPFNGSTPNTYAEASPPPGSIVSPPAISPSPGPIYFSYAAVHPHGGPPYHVPAGHNPSQGQYLTAAYAAAPSHHHHHHHQHAHQSPAYVVPMHTSYPISPIMEPTAFFHHQGYHPPVPGLASAYNWRRDQ